MLLCLWCALPRTCESPVLAMTSRRSKKVSSCKPRRCRPLCAMPTATFAWSCRVPPRKGVRSPSRGACTQAQYGRRA